MDKRHDGVITSTLHYQEHDGQFSHERTQPTEDLILERNAQLRNNPGAIDDLGAKMGLGETWGRQVASIPFILWEKAIRDGFALNSPDSKIREREVFRFLQTPEGKSCLVR